MGVRRRAILVRAFVLVWLLSPAAWLGAETIDERLQSMRTRSLTVAERHEELDAIFSELDESRAAPRLLATAYVERAYAYLEGGRLDDGMATVSEALGRITVDQAPDEFVYLRALRAALLLSNGQTEASVEEYGALLASLPTGVDEGVVLRTRANYGSALFEAGRVLEAAEVLRESIPQAEALGNDRLALGFANNLLVILIQTGQYEDAREWLGRLEPLRARSKDLSILSSILLHEFELQRIFGDAAGAADGLAHFLQTTEEDNASVIGNAHEYLADAERDLGRLEESEASARRAVALLEAVPWELADAKISLARTLLAQGRSSEALEVLDAISASAQQSAARASDLSALRLEAQLREAGLGVATDELDRLLTTLEADRSNNSLQYVRYYDAKLEAQRQESEIAQLETRQAALRSNRNLTIALVVLAASMLIALLYSRNRRSYQRKLLASEQEQNRALAEQVEEKSAALKRQLEEQAAMERALNEKRQIELIGEIAGNVAHDFNNLLQVVSSANERVGGRVDDPELLEVLQASDRSLDYASDITRQLLAFARQQELETRSVDIAALLRKSERLFRSAAGEEVRVLFDMPSEAIALVDPAKLTTAILNLLRNSVDAMPDGGVVRVSVTSQQFDRPEKVGWVALPPGGYVVINVTDDGAGMDEATLAKACQPFYTTKLEDSGTGLGLSSVYGFVRQSGGDLRIESACDDGTRVTIAIPSAARSPVPATESREKVTHESLPGRVLVVEDNELVAASICSLLNDDGIRTTLFPSADEAMSDLGHFDGIDLVLTDVRMPGRHDGYDLARWLAEQRPELSVILMSGFTHHRYEEIPFPLMAVGRWVVEASRRAEPIAPAQARWRDRHRPASKRRGLSSSPTTGNEMPGRWAPASCFGLRSFS